VAAIEYDPNRSARIALLHYTDGEKRYNPLAGRRERGRRAAVGRGGGHPPGKFAPAARDPARTVITTSSEEGHGAQLIRSAGSFGQLMAKEASTRRSACPRPRSARSCSSARPPWPARQHRARDRPPSARRAGTGRLAADGARPGHESVDHPHGGGEGKSGQGNPHPVSPWGQPTKGIQDARQQAHHQFIIKTRDKRIR